MNVGIDMHGVVTQYPSIFSELSYELHSKGHVIHIITGVEGIKVMEEVKTHNIYFDQIFSIVDWHKHIKTEMWERTKPSGRKSWYCEETIWNKSKGEYCEKAHIDIHFDDTLEYAKYFPNFTTFIHVPKVGFEKFYKMFLV